MDCTRTHAAIGPCRTGGLPHLAVYSSPCTPAGEDHEEDYPQDDLQRVQGCPAEAHQAGEALRDLRQEAQDQGPDVLERLVFLVGWIISPAFTTLQFYNNTAAVRRISPIAPYRSSAQFLRQTEADDVVPLYGAIAATATATERLR